MKTKLYAGLFLVFSTITFLFTNVVYADETSNFELITSKTSINFNSNNFQIGVTSNLGYLTEDGNVIEYQNIYQNEYNSNNYPIYYNDTEFLLKYRTVEQSELILSYGTHTGKLNDFIALNLEVNQEIIIDNQGIVKIDGQQIDINFKPYTITLTPLTVYDNFESDFENYHITYLFNHSRIYEDFVGYRLILKESRHYDIDITDYYIDIPKNYNLLYSDNNNSGFFNLNNDRLNLNYSYTSGAHRFNVVFDNQSIKVLNLDNDSLSSKNWSTFNIFPDNLRIITSVRANNTNKVPYHLITSKNKWSDIVDDFTKLVSFDTELIDKEKQTYVFSLNDGPSKYYDPNINVLLGPNQDISNVDIVYRYISTNEDAIVNIKFVDQNENLLESIDVNLKDYLGNDYNGTYLLSDIDININDYVPEGHVLYQTKYIDPTVDDSIRNYWDHSRFSGDAIIILNINEINDDISITIKGTHFFASDYILELHGKVGEPIELIGFEAPKILGHRFIGLIYNSASELYNEDDIFINDTILYLDYETVEHLNISFNVNGGVYLEPIKLPASKYNRTVAERLPVPVKSKAIFLGWFLDEELKIPAPKEISFSSLDDIQYYDVTFYASWAENSTIVHFHTNQKSLEISSRVITKGEFINISLPPKIDGYIFHGWFLDEELTVEYDGLGLTDDVVNLYAKWIVDEDNPPPTDNDNDFGEGQETDNYNLYLAIGIGVGILGLLLFFTKPKSRKKR